MDLKNSRPLRPCPALGCPPNHRVTVSPISSFTLTNWPHWLLLVEVYGYIKIHMLQIDMNMCILQCYTIPDVIQYILRSFLQSPHDKGPIYIYIETYHMMRNSREFPHWDHVIAHFRQLQPLVVEPAKKHRCQIFRCARNLRTTMIIIFDTSSCGAPGVHLFCQVVGRELSYHRHTKMPRKTHG